MYQQAGLHKRRFREGQPKGGFHKLRNWEPRFPIVAKEEVPNANLFSAFKVFKEERLMSRMACFVRDCTVR